MHRRNDHDGRDEETTYSGELGERNRNTPGRTPGERFDLDHGST